MSWVWSHICTFNIATCTSKHIHISNHQHAQIISAPHKPKGDVLLSDCQIIISFLFFSLSTVCYCLKAWLSKVMSSQYSHTCTGSEKAEQTQHTRTHMLETCRIQYLTASSRDTDLLLLMSFLRLMQSYGLTWTVLLQSMRAATSLRNALWKYGRLSINKPNLRVITTKKPLKFGNADW